MNSEFLWVVAGLVSWMIFFLCMIYFLFFMDEEKDDKKLTWKEIVFGTMVILFFAILFSLIGHAMAKPLLFLISIIRNWF